MFLLIGKCFVLVCKHQLYQATLRAVYITVIGVFDKMESAWSFSQVLYFSGLNPSQFHRLCQCRWFLDNTGKITSLSMMPLGCVGHFDK